MGVSEITYFVSNGTLNLKSVSQSVSHEEMSLIFFAAHNPKKI